MESEVKFEQQSNVQGKLFEIGEDNYHLQSQQTQRMNELTLSTASEQMIDQLAFGSSNGRPRGVRLIYRL